VTGPYALAVAGVVVGFSLSSTLAKRADTAGVLIGFWRLTLATTPQPRAQWRADRQVPAMGVVWASAMRHSLSSSTAM
jgi:hypothetical protein